VIKVSHDVAEGICYTPEERSVG